MPRNRIKQYVKRLLHLCSTGDANTSSLSACEIRRSEVGLLRKHDSYMLQGSVPQISTDYNYSFQSRIKGNLKYANFNRSSRKKELRWGREGSTSPSCVRGCEARSSCKRELWKKTDSYTVPLWPDCGCQKRPWSVQFCIFSHNTLLGYIHYGHFPICARTDPSWIFCI